MNNIKLFSKLIHFALLLSLALFTACTNHEPENAFKFVFMTDIHVQQELNGDEGFRQAINKINSIKPDFVITGGDLVFDALGQSYEKATQLYDLYFDVSKNFTMPVYNTLGNHEVFGLYEKSGVSPDHKEYGKKMYLKRTGYKNTYYSFDHKNWHFMVLDDIGFTENRRYIAEIDSLQINWIKEDLKNISPKTPIAIALHIPLVSISEQMRSGGTAALSPRIALANSNQILQLFDGYNLKLVLQGHLHIVEEIIFRDTHFITAGAVCGAWWKGPRAGFNEGFVVIETSGNDFTWKYETYGWQTVYQEEKFWLNTFKSN